MRFLKILAHEALMLLTPLRARLKCPHCGAIGTWRPHGGWVDRRRGSKRFTRRWLCKWCGYYRGEDGVRQQFIDVTKRCWVGRWEGPPEYRYLLEISDEKFNALVGSRFFTPRHALPDVNPWAG